MNARERYENVMANIGLFDMLDENGKFNEKTFNYHMALMDEAIKEEQEEERNREQLAQEKQEQLAQEKQEQEKRFKGYLVDWACCLFLIVVLLGNGEAFSNARTALWWGLGFLVGFWVLRAVVRGIKAFFKDALFFDWVCLALGAALLLWWAIAAL